MPVTTKSKAEKLFARIQKDNKRYKRVGVERQRVLIAQDVIEWMKTKFITATEGEYVKGKVSTDSELDDENFEDDQFHETLLAMPDCKACGVGALLVARCMRFDQVTNSEMSVYSKEDNISLDSGEIDDGLDGIFSDKQLSMIETAFEVFAPATVTVGVSRRHIVAPASWREEPMSSEFEYLSDKAQYDCFKFGKRFKSAETRMIGIMKNIIKNEGTFKP